MDDSEVKHGFLDFYLSSWASKSVVFLLGLQSPVGAWGHGHVLVRFLFWELAQEAYLTFWSTFASLLIPAFSLLCPKCWKWVLLPAVDILQMRAVWGPIDGGQELSFPGVFPGGSDFHAPNLTHDTWQACLLNCPHHSRRWAPPSFDGGPLCNMRGKKATDLRNKFYFLIKSLSSYQREASSLRSISYKNCPGVFH